jgi:hypothetical protein
MNDLHRLCLDQVTERREDADIAKVAFALLETRGPRQRGTSIHPGPTSTRAAQALATLNRLEDIQIGQKRGARQAFPNTKSVFWEALCVEVLVGNSSEQAAYASKLLSYSWHGSDSFVEKEQEALTKTFRESIHVVAGWDLIDPLEDLIQLAAKEDRKDSPLLDPIVHGYCTRMLTDHPSQLLNLFRSPEA